MKIRIKGNSLRYRLSRSEVSNLAAQGHLTEEVEFPVQNFQYILQVTQSPYLSASYSNHIITIFIPLEMVQELASTDTIGFKGDFEKLSLLVEKDFVCIDQTEEDQSDNYPHPDPSKC